MSTEFGHVYLQGLQRANRVQKYLDSKLKDSVVKLHVSMKVNRYVGFYLYTFTITTFTITTVTGKYA